MKTEGKEYKKKMIKYIKEEVKRQQWGKIESQFIYLDEVVYMNKKGRDADNLKKLTQDVITESEVVWTDDTYCWARTQRVYIDRFNPRIEIILTPTNTVGIFDSQEDLDSFVNIYCNNCSNGKLIGKKGGCTIYKGLLENRVLEEVDINFETGEKKCLGFKSKNK